MNGPMFIREPVIGFVRSTADDAPSPVAAIAGLGPAGDLVEEATLIEEISAIALTRSTAAGALTIYLQPPYPESAVLHSEYPMPAGTADLRASIRIRLDLTLPVGWGLSASHDCDWTLLDICVPGGIVR